MMKIKENLVELTALLLVILVLIGLPIAIWWYEQDYLPSRYPEGAKIINLSAMAPEEGCLWTQERITSFNYWWKDFQHAEEIMVKEGDLVIFRVKSSDVLHSFGIPRFRIGPYEVEAGKVTEVEFEARREGRFKYLCWLWCSDCHSDLTGRIVVTAPE